MTRFISYLLFFLIMFTVPSVCFASTNDDDDDDNIEVIVTDEIPITDDPNNIGRRSAPRPIHITISSINGVTIPNVDKSEVISYEIYDLNGNCIGAYIDDIDFANHLFSSNSTLQIKIILDGHILVGWVKL